MDNERSAVINIGGTEHELILTTKATKAIAVGTVDWRTLVRS